MRLTLATVLLLLCSSEAVLASDGDTKSCLALTQYADYEGTGKPNYCNLIPSGHTLRAKYCSSAEGGPWFVASQPFKLSDEDQYSFMEKVIAEIAAEDVEREVNIDIVCTQKGVACEGCTGTAEPLHTVHLSFGRKREASSCRYEGPLGDALDSDLVPTIKNVSASRSGFTHVSFITKGIVLPEQQYWEAIDLIVTLNGPNANSMSDLSVIAAGKILPGIGTNAPSSGAFSVDIKSDYAQEFGVYISRLAETIKEKIESLC